jgi:hypothetical protein
MTSLCLTHRVLAINRAPTAGTTLTDIASQMQLTAEGGHAHFLPSSDLVPHDMKAAAATEESAVAAHLPTALRGRLQVEVGWVEQAIRRDRLVVARRRQFYVLSTCRGVVLTLRAALEADRRIAWVRTVDTKELGVGLPVVLGPSAVLALVLHCLATVPSDPVGGALSPVVPVPIAAREAESPYPPHTSPLALLSQGELLDADLPAVYSTTRPFPGTAQARFLLRPERWSRPVEALPADAIDSVFVSCHAGSPLPDRAVVVDALTALTDEGKAAHWRAEVSLLDGERGMAAGTEPLDLHLDAWQLLASVRGALGMPQPAAAHDPLAGRRYGVAPAVVVDASADDLLRCGA